jgi:pSer/pThr/pTyr-binding forkhead associated (FHA) protein
MLPGMELHRSTPQELQARISAERTNRAFLLYRDGEGTQRILGLGDAPDRLTIGRNPSNWLALPWDSEASRVHATLERLGDEWTLVDDGRARNGTFVDGERVSGRRRLRDGETLQMGRTVMLFRSPEDETAVTELSAHAVPPPISAAQLRVLQALCRPYGQGRFATPASNAEIAAELVIGVETVKTHMKALYEAFDLEGTGNRAELARRALEAGLV